MRLVRPSPPSAQVEQLCSHLPLAAPSSLSLRLFQAQFGPGELFRRMYADMDVPYLYQAHLEGKWKVFL